MTGEIVRILLRYLAMFLVARGYFSAEVGDTITHDPQLAAAIEMAVGAALAGATELWFIVVKRWKIRRDKALASRLATAEKQVRAAQ